MLSHQDEILQTQLPPTVAAPSLARSLVRSAGSSLSPSLLDDAQLLVSEVVSNLLAHASEPHPIQLRMMRTHRMVSLEVEEIPQSVHAPSIRPGGTMDRNDASGPHPSPWGRDLVATLADAWGVSARDGRTSAWAELRLDR